MTASLDGLLVVSLEQAVAAPYCSRLLAEGGARVIKLERLEGDFARAYDDVINGESGYFVWLNAGKESLAVDLKREDDRTLLTTIIQRADVFIQNLRPGAVDRLGFGYLAVKALNPRLVMCSISGYGLTGPYAGMKAYDALIQAESGLCSVTGPPGHPSKVGASICDISTGLTAYGEILKALIRRARDERGAHVEVSLFEVTAEWLAVPLATYEYGGKLLGGTGMDHAQIAPYGAFETLDGPIFMVVQNHREWVQLCTEILGRPALTEDLRYKTNMSRVENKNSLRGEIEACFTQFNRAEMASKLGKAGIACGNINDISDLQHHPALVKKEVVSSGQRISLVRRAGDEAPQPARVPALDEHGASIRAEFA